MRLKSFSVQRFRNVLASGEIPLNGSVTCLVGKNESGKTNLLHALDSLRSATGRSLGRLDYPRWLEKDHQRSGEFDTAQPITASFVLDDEDAASIEETFGEGVLASRDFQVSKGYANNWWFAIETHEEWACQQVLVDHQLVGDVKSVPALRKHLAGLATETTTDGASNAEPTDVATRATAAQAQLEERYGTDTVANAIGRALAARIPRFFYFDEYAELAGRTAIEPLVQALDNNNVSQLGEAQRTALTLLQLGFANDELMSNEYEHRSGELEAMAASLTKRVLAYWKQNPHLRLRIDVDRVPVRYTTDQGLAAQRVEQFLQLRVEDTRHFFTNSLDARSSGFRWFVSFLAAFTEFEADENVVVLLDEPALGLHARAQDDFLRYIAQELAAKHQVIYTTHSPFMIDAAHLERVRVVEDEGPADGAVARTQLMSHDPDTLSPLRGALGFDIAHDLFVGPNNLVVEGLSDYTYLTVISEALRVAGREHLDQRWRILPAGSASNVPTFVALLGRHLDVTVLVDSSTQPGQRLQALVHGGLFVGTRIITPARATGLIRADIEDVFDIQDYLDIFNAALNGSVNVEGLPSGYRIVARIEASHGAFNHNDPANHLLSNRLLLVEHLRPKTLDQFEALIHELNATLS